MMKREQFEYATTRIFKTFGLVPTESRDHMLQTRGLDSWLLVDVEDTPHFRDYTFARLKEEK